MERLTKWNGKKYVLADGMGYGQTRIITERLAAFENLCVDPAHYSGAIEAITDLCSYLCDKLDESTDNVYVYHAYMDVYVYVMRILTKNRNKILKELKECQLMCTDAQKQTR